MAEMPPDIVGEVLRTAVHLPLAAHVERLVVHEEDAARPFAFAVAERGDVNAFGTAVYGVRPGIAGPLCHSLGLDHLHDLRVLGIGFGIEDMDARRSQPGHHEVAALSMGVWRVRAETRRAGVPAEVVQLVTCIGHRGRVHDLGVVLRLWIDINDRDCIRRLAGRIEGSDVGKRLGCRLHGHAGGWVEAWIGPSRRQRSGSPLSRHQS